MEMKKIVSWAKRRGFAYPQDEIYGGLNAVYNFGPYGALLKQNLREYFIQEWVRKWPNIHLIESAIITHQKTLQASGHVKNFSDKLVECKSCHERFRFDLTEGACPGCGKKDFSEPTNFNLMLESHLGAVKDNQNKIYFRPETAQGMFTSYRYLKEIMRAKLPFGLAQIGKSFRNEITARQFIFRLREFEIVEIEYFVAAEKADQEFRQWVDRWQEFIESLGINKESLRQRQHQRKELAHYSKATTDIEYKFPFGWGEIAGIANRGDFDLKAHFRKEIKDFPYVIEPTASLERLMIAVLVDGYTESDGSDGRKKGERVFKVSSRLAPVKVGIFPLIRKPELIRIAKEIVKDLSNCWQVEYDETGSIGRRYRRIDEIGVPVGITVDFDTLKDQTVTIRDRDTMKQERVKIGKLKDHLLF
jgi:glycyl-tRNA synthetase